MALQSSYNLPPIPRSPPLRNESLPPLLPCQADNMPSPPLGGGHSTFAMPSPIKPGQYSRKNSHDRDDIPSALQPAPNTRLAQHHASSPNKENNPLARGRPTTQPIAIAKSNPLVDPKYRLRGNSPEDSQRESGSSSIFSRSFSPSKNRSRSKSRSRLFSRDKIPDGVLAEQQQPPKSKQEIDSDFANLLDEMQVAPDLRKKLIGMDTTVKAAMLKGQATLSLSSFGIEDSSSSSSSATSPSKARKPIPDKLLRKPRSAANLKQQSVPDDDEPEFEMLQPPNRASLFGGLRSASGGSYSSSSDTSAKSSSKRASIDVFQGLKNVAKSPNLGQGGSVLSLQSTSTASSGGTRGRALSFGKDTGVMLSKETPESFATMLKTTDARSIEVAKVKRMRAVVASESPAWISQFIGPECAGYEAMVLRLQELLQMEWREEQHDDMLLHELLRCFVALSTTDVGKGALQSRAPTPFKELVDLLFSEKKPGDIPTRKYMVDLLAILLELQIPLGPETADSPVNFLLRLLQNPVDPAKEQVVDFIKQTHTPRPFKTYLIELAGVCRDYFWIFCHSQNRFWRHEDLDADSIKGPKVPGGMTGGVEFEAMAYLTTHLRLINSVASALDSPASPRCMTAYEFHMNLFASGLERILATLRRSSQHYYAPLHLELARYISLARSAEFRLPHHLTDWLAAPLNPEPSAAPSGYGIAAQYISTSPPKPVSAGGTGRWLARPTGAASAGDFPNPFESDQAKTDSVVGSAIRKWESRALGLGLGQAPTPAPTAAPPRVPSQRFGS